MVTVKGEQIAQPVTYKPRIEVRFNTGDGATSQVSWHNPTVEIALRKLFRAADDEVLTKVVFTEEGVTANLTRVKE